MNSKTLIPTRIKLFFCKDKELYSSLHQLLGFYPRDISVYKQALLHKSIKQKDEQGKRVNNERLEFLGDAVLSAIVGDILYRRYDDKREGFLTITRSKIVQRKTLNKVSAEIGLDKLTLESTHHLTHNNNIYGNAFEALMGAIYLDRGYKGCQQFFERRIMHSLIDIDAIARKEINFKSRLLEWCQKNRLTLSFELKQQEMGNEGPVFISQAVIEGLEGCTGRGFSKKESQQKAAHETYNVLMQKKTYYKDVMAARKEQKKESTEEAACS